VVEHDELIAAIEARDIAASDEIASAHADQIVRQIQSHDLHVDRRQTVKL